MKQALVIGIDDYAGGARLRGCVNDATAVARLLNYNGDESLNFHVNLATNVTTKTKLRGMIRDLFNCEADTVLLYFSGHGYSDEYGGCLVTPDAKEDDLGVPMDQILQFANGSDIKNKIIILDCCRSGVFGNPVHTPGTTFLRKGITILTASRDMEASIEVNGHGVFTSLLLDALEGGAADLKGDITPGSIYAHIDTAIGPWGQRPMFKSNITRFTAIRSVRPAIETSSLKLITTYFKNNDDGFKLDRTYEWTNKKVAIKTHVAIFKTLQRMNRVGLVVPVDEEDMYWAAQNEKSCRLTQLGKYYWKLVKSGVI